MGTLFFSSMTHCNMNELCQVLEDYCIWRLTLEEGFGYPLLSLIISLVI